MLSDRVAHLTLRGAKQDGVAAAVQRCPRLESLCVVCDQVRVPPSLAPRWPPARHAPCGQMRVEVCAMHGVHTLVASLR